MTDIKLLFEWNAWANERYRNVFREIGIDNLRIDTPYGNMLDRIVHIFASFEMWHKRMQGLSPSTVIKADQFTTWDDLESTWIKFDKLLIDYVSELNIEDMQRYVEYTSLDGKQYRRKIQHILLHLTAHPNYHRGQISSMFKMMKIADLPATDMVVFFLQ